MASGTSLVFRWRIAGLVPGSNRIFARLLTLLAPAMLAPVPAHAARPPDASWTFTAQFENDLFANTDRFYTNGLRLSWVSPDLEWFQDLDWFRRNQLINRWGNRVIQALPYSHDPERQRNVALSVGQLMFTPEDISRRELIAEDRPYAGWLYGSAAFHSKTYRRLDTFEIQAGLTGSWSLAQQAQDLIHDLRGIDKARGWDNQIGTEPGFALVYERKLRVLPSYRIAGLWGMDAIAHFGGAVGTVFTHAEAGAELRAGWNIPSDFGTAVIRPAGETNMPTDTSDPRYRAGLDTFGFHVFAAVSGRYVLRNIFLDGNTFTDSHSVDKKDWVGDVALGVSVVYHRFKLSYAQVWRSREFRAQRNSQAFGSLSLSYTY